ncbi:DUF4185 domain-containing protein [Mycobacterium sp.]|uniref:DUF4185 domain-containing protein n=1 Tax=Mycobacterium sp. TaxID=1785 RepID=UPI003A885300
MSPISRIISASAASAAAFGLVVPMSLATGLAPQAHALTCDAPEANVAPPANAVVTTPGGKVLGPIRRGPRPRGANDRAPRPALGPLQRLLQPSRQYSAPIQQQARVPGANPAPPAPVPPVAAQQPPAAPLAPEAAAAPPPNPAPVAAPPAGAPNPDDAFGGSTTSLAEWVTGPEGPNRTLERFGISGTDVGLMWDNGDPADHQVLMAFGDTFGYCAVHGDQWRYNVLFRSNDRNLSDGIHIGDGDRSNRYAGSPTQQPGFSRQVINSINYATEETGIIPTAAISVGKTQYINFMSIRDWGRDGEWWTNYSGIAVSNDNGQTWGVYPGTIRASGPDTGRAPYVEGNENFQMGAYVKANDGYLYSFGTPAGRGGSAHLSRVPQGVIPDLTKYQYWNGDSNSWVPGRPSAATPVIPGPVAEMSAQYNTYLKQYLVMYTNGANDVVARTAPAPQGPYGPEHLLVSNFQMPGGVYAPMMHPWTTGKDVYFNLSLWSAYDVMLMHTELG